jgi:Bromodomain/Zinc finger, ZZ type
MEARTLVYQEVMVGYFKWAQMRGFKNGHIWSCPPQRGDNFIFWCHPAHQRTPSRDRLNAWYNSILLRSSKMGILEEVGTLWSAYFSGYGRRESSGRKDKDKEETKSALGGASCDDDAGSAVTADLCVQLPTPVPVAASSSSSSGRHGKLDGTTAGGEPEDAPICPPVFEGDFWVTECMRVHRLVMGRSKGCDGQDRGVNQRKCRDLLKDLMSKPSSMPFCRPVDIVKLCIPDYPTVIPEPMDLGTIRDLLRTRYYRSILHFAEAVRLTFRNAMRYNPPGHPINEIARLLSIEFEQSLVDLLSEYIGAVPKAENVNKYLDSYPIADSLPVPGTAAEPLAEESKKAPLSLGPTAAPASDELPRDRTRRRSGVSLEIKTEADGDSGLLGNQTPLSTAEGDTDTGTPQLRRADSMDSVASYGSLLNDSTHAGEAPDGWTPRLMFASSALSGPIPVPAEGEGGVLRETLKPFEKPALGFKGALALMSEISKSVFRLKDDLFVIKFADPSKRPRAPPLRKKVATDSENIDTGERQTRENDEDSADVSDIRPIHVAPSSRAKAKGVCFSEPVCLPAEESVGFECRGDDSLSVTHNDCDLEEQGMSVDQKDSPDSIPLEPSSPDKLPVGIESAEAEGSEGATPSEPHSAHDQDLTAWTLEGDQGGVAMAMGGAGPVSCSLDSTTTSTSYEEEGGQDQEHDTSEPESDYVIVPSPAASPRAPTGRRGRDSGRRRTGHHKKSRSPKRRAGKSPATFSEPVPVFDEPPTALNGTSSATAAAAGKLKGGKAGAYLKRMSGERDQGCDGDSDRGEGFEEAFSEKCVDLLSQLIPDTSDPDPLLKCAFVDSRHTFLEMCQFRHYQFDTLRRAKHSSLMLLYHLHFPDNLNARPTCACCAGPIRDVRWHCDQCADFDVCDVCYRATDTESDANDTHGLPAVRGKPKGKEGPKKVPVPLAALRDPLPVTAEKHSHPLTPFRITYI